MFKRISPCKSVSEKNLFRCGFKCITREKQLANKEDRKKPSLFPAKLHRQCCCRAWNHASVGLPKQLALSHGDTAARRKHAVDVELCLIKAEWKLNGTDTHHYHTKEKKKKKKKGSRIPEESETKSPNSIARSTYVGRGVQ
ncbi:unnamed protein product [Sphenostylis stenocarpa]|uniref:Uncharacterized protein n=1 Tax=Sphenostylis stenocarpa TaxID=92480 RepID=A0AA86VQ31_9FABA|nr:unnamed protein product [Sphenostylis stenocarpa]